MDVMDWSNQSSLTIVFALLTNRKRSPGESWLRRSLLGLTCGIIAACSGGGPRADLVVLNGAEPESIDPAVITGQIEERVVLSLFEGLTRFNRRYSEPMRRVMGRVARREDLHVQTPFDRELEQRPTGYSN
jgi:ABC-type oligopeptide transport system substrate-binding subunit